MEITFIFLNSIYFLLLIQLIKLVNNKVETPKSQLNLNDVTLLIPFHNEASGIPELAESLSAILNKYPHLNVLLIDDNSTDEGYEIIMKWISNNSEFHNLQILQIKDGRASKKKAVSTALKSVKTKWILQTDADCILSPEWIKDMTSVNNKLLNFVAGPVAFNGLSFWSMFLELESWALIGMARAGFLNSKPQYCSAANMLWNMNALEEPYDEIINMTFASGDDTFLMNYFHELDTGKMDYAWKKQALVWTKAPGSFSGFIRQRLRWTSKWNTGGSNSQLIFPVLIWVYHLLFILLAIYFFVTSSFLILAMVWTLRAIFEFLFLKKTAEFFGSKISLIHFLILEILYSPYVVFFGLGGQILSYKWKDHD